MVNDVSGGKYDAAMLPTVCQYRVPIILMHNPISIYQLPHATFGAAPYRDVVIEVRDTLTALAARARSFGLTREQIILDPGIGFRKSCEDNLRLLNHLKNSGLKPRGSLSSSYLENSFAYSGLKPRSVRK